MSGVAELCGGLREPLVVHVHLMPGNRMPAELDWDLEAAAENCRHFECWHSALLTSMFLFILLVTAALFFMLGYALHS